VCVFICLSAGKKNESRFKNIKRINKKIGETNDIAQGQILVKFGWKVDEKLIEVYLCRTEYIESVIECPFCNSCMIHNLIAEVYSLQKYTECPPVGDVTH
jgi:Zn finger protein HypA/HybF involved in hydrogenase expression